MPTEAKRLLDDRGFRTAFVPAPLGGMLLRLDGLSRGVRPVFRRDVSLGFGHGLAALCAAAPCGPAATTGSVTGSPDQGGCRKSRRPSAGRAPRSRGGTARASEAERAERALGVPAGSPRTGCTRSSAGATRGPAEHRSWRRWRTPAGRRSGRVRAAAGYAVPLLVRETAHDLCRPSWVPHTSAETASTGLAHPDASVDPGAQFVGVVQQDPVGLPPSPRECGRDPTPCLPRSPKRTSAARKPWVSPRNPMRSRCPAAGRTSDDAGVVAGTGNSPTCSRVTSAASKTAAESSASARYEAVVTPAGPPPNLRWRNRPNSHRLPGQGENRVRDRPDTRAGCVNAPVPHSSLTRSAPERPVDRSSRAGPPRPSGTPGRRGRSGPRAAASDRRAVQ